MKLDDGKDKICLGFEDEYAWNSGTGGIINLELESAIFGRRKTSFMGNQTTVWE